MHKTDSVVAENDCLICYFFSCNINYVARKIMEAVVLLIRLKLMISFEAHYCFQAVLDRVANLSVPVRYQIILN